MITLEELQNMWQIDCKVDELNLGQESTRIPELHSKYLNLLTTYRLQCRKAQSDMQKMRRLKWKFYRGELDQKELNDLGWEQYLGNAPLNNQMNEFLDTDDDIIRLTDKLEYVNTCFTLCESVMKSINNRSFDIKNAIEWTKFSNGLL